MNLFILEKDVDSPNINERNNVILLFSNNFSHAAIPHLRHNDLFDSW